MPPSLEEFEVALRDLDARHLRRVRRLVDGPWGPIVRADFGAGPREVLAFCSNDYLGLASHPAVAAALARGARELGAGSGASPLISGHARAHQELEDRFAGVQSPHIPQCRSLLFATGYLANIGAITALADEDTEIFSEQLNHASLIDGVRLSGARRSVYPHADTAALGELLRASTARRRLIVTDAVFSMDGDLAPLPALLALAEEHDAILFVDDAHGFGVLGEHGAGSLSHWRLRSERLVLVGTLGKALGVAGAFVAAHATLVEWLVQRARPYIFSTAPPAALAVALDAALGIVLGAEGDTRRARLAAHARALHAGLEAAPWRLLPSHTPIQPVVVGGNEETMALAAQLLAAGFWVPGIRPPTVPEGTSRLRITLSAAHEDAHIARLVRALNAAAAAERSRGAQAP